MIVFGPVPSRRLGRSIGINNIPPKKCSYSCVYCQLGKTNHLQIAREEFYEPQDIFQQVKDRLKELKDKNESVDYLTFVSDGEPTLDANLGKTIDLLKTFNINIAVITNASLIWQDEVKEHLQKADWVSLKIDAASQEVWHRLNRAHGGLDFKQILKGTLEFAENFQGTLVTETMLVESYNDAPENIKGIGLHLQKLKPAKSYLLVPTRPPAMTNIKRVTPKELQKIYQTIKELAEIEVECITGDEGEEFFMADNALTGLLSIISVHPIKRDVLEKLFKEKGLPWILMEDLLQKGQVESFFFEDQEFFRKKL